MVKHSRHPLGEHCARTVREVMKTFRLQVPIPLGTGCATAAERRPGGAGKQATEEHLLCDPVGSGHGHGYFLAAPFCGVIGKQPYAWSVPALKEMTVHAASAALGHFDRGGFGSEVFILQLSCFGVVAKITNLPPRPARFRRLPVSAGDSDGNGCPLGSRLHLIKQFEKRPNPAFVGFPATTFSSYG